MYNDISDEWYKFICDCDEERRQERLLAEAAALAKANHDPALDAWEMREEKDGSSPSEGP